MSVPSAAPETIVRVARNSASESENRIHSEEEARRYGYRGALVPGVTLYAYLSQVFLPFFGAEWLGRGSATVRFERPVYEGERLECVAAERRDGGVPATSGGRPIIDLRCVTAEGKTAASGSAWLRDAPALPAECEVPVLPVLDPPALRPALTPADVPVGQPLAPFVSDFNGSEAAAYAEETDDPSPWWRVGPAGGPALLPPGVIAGRQARLLRLNFAFGPSIHAASEIHHVAPAPAAGRVRTGGVIRETFERKGNHYLVLDAPTEMDGTLVAFIRHTSIFQVREA